MAGKRDAGGLGFDMGALGRLTTPELEGSRIGERTESPERVRVSREGTSGGHLQGCLRQGPFPRENSHV